MNNRQEREAVFASLGDHTQNVIISILNELARAEEKHPAWPDDLIYASAIVGEEAGELIRAAINCTIGNDWNGHVIEESIQVGAMAIRLLKNNFPSLLSTSEGASAEVSQLFTRAYIAGAVRNLQKEEVEEKFGRKEFELRSNRFLVTNPITLIERLNAEREFGGLQLLDDDNEDDRKAIMKTCIAAMLLCDEVHLLHDWQRSAGALMEHDFAQRVGMKIVYP